MLQTLGGGIFIREVLLRRAANQAGHIRKHAIAAHRSHSKIASTSNISRKRTNFKKNDPFSAEEIRARLGGTNIRHSERFLSTNKTETDLEDLLKDAIWHPVYRFKGIGFCYLISRLKLLQTIASACLIPYAAFLFQNGQITSFMFSTIVSGAIFAPIALIIFTKYYNRVIGVISMDESNNFIRIGYLSFWGSRRNKYLDVADAIPLSELPLQDTWSPIIIMRFYSTNNVLYLFTKDFEIVDKEKAELLFGDLSKLYEEKIKQ